jgi:hypothetical protein
MDLQSIGQFATGRRQRQHGGFELASALSRDLHPKAQLHIRGCGEGWTERLSTRSAIPGRKIVAMLNMDMIGRSQDDQVCSAAPASPAFRRWRGAATSAASRSGVSAATAASSHQSFYKHPVLFSFRTATDYHRLRRLGQNQRRRR